MNAVNNKITATRYSSSPSPSWTVEAVKKIISKTDPQLIKIICNEKIKIISFETAYDKWKYSEGGIEENKVTGLLGHTKREKMEIWLTAAMTNELAAITLFHEMGHITRMPPTTHEEAIDEEINVRVETEAFAIRQSMPPTSQGYRTADGKVDRTFIEAQVRNCSHYNPIGRKFIGRRYVGEKNTTGWCSP